MFYFETFWKMRLCSCPGFPWGSEKLSLVSRWTGRGGVDRAGQDETLVVGTQFICPWIPIH